MLMLLFRMQLENLQGTVETLGLFNEVKKNVWNAKVSCGNAQNPTYKTGRTVYVSDFLTLLQNLVSSIFYGY